VTRISPSQSLNSNTHISMPQDWRTAFADTWNDNTERQSTLNCIFQPTRPQHISGCPDPMPFTSKSETQAVFTTLRLPSSYFQMAHGTAGSTQAHTTRQQHPGRPERYEFTAHYNTRLGDWALALSHDAERRITSVFWSVDKRIDSVALLDDFNDFKQYALHPLLVPCIMFASNLRVNEQRQRSIKKRMRELEICLQQNILEEASPASSSAFDRDGKVSGGPRRHGDQTQPPSLETHFQVLHTCRADQSSWKGRYRFWQSFAESLEEGFQYVESLMAASPDAHLLEAHQELRRWVDVNDKKHASLMARAEDHVCRIDNASHMVFSRR
jgi:hypothetical protein